MRNEVQKFHETVDILVKAYLNDTLIHGSCHMCAVGNIVAGKNNIEFKHDEFAYGKKRWDVGCPTWDLVFCCDSATPGKLQSLYPQAYQGSAKDEIDSTGYSWQELAMVELAFESAKDDENRMFNGLMAVVDVLAEIHKIDLSQKEQAKALFVK